MRFRKEFFKIYAKAHEISRNIICNRDIKHRYKNLTEHGISLKKLTPEQKKQIDAVWSDIIPKGEYSTHELIYSITGNFDPCFCPIKYCTSKLTLMINNEEYIKAWGDKNYFEKYFPNIKFPTAIVRNINGVFYDRQYSLITKEKAIELLGDYQEVCIKPTRASGSGIAVKKVAVDGKIERVLDSYKKDYIVQEILSQYEPLKKLNPTSVNVARIITLFINNKATVLSSTFRCGALGAFNDNSISKNGEGMFVIGVTDDGVLKDVGYYSCGVNIKKSHSGAEFAGIQLPNFDKAKEISLEIATQMPFARFVGFDIVFDEAGEPIVMEYNLYDAGTFYYQVANGPLFGDRTQEVIDFIKENENKRDLGGFI